MDFVKSERARNVLANLIGKCVLLSVDGKQEECVVSGIYGVFEVQDEEHLCFTFQKLGKYGCEGDPKDTFECLQMAIEHYETLLNDGEYNDDGIFSLKLI